MEFTHISHKEQYDGVTVNFGELFGIDSYTHFAEILCNIDSKHLPENLLISIEDMKTNIVLSNYIEIVKVNDIIVAYCILLDDDNQFNMFICVSPEYQSNGLGTIMMNNMIKINRSNIRSKINKNDSRTLNFYKKFGFTPIKMWSTELETCMIKICKSVIDTSSESDE